MNRIKELRIKNGKQQKELAIELGISQPTISDWESGRKIPSAKNTARLAEYFDVSIDYLLCRDHARSIGADSQKENKKPIHENEDEPFDTFTYAMQNECRNLTEADKNLLLSMAKQLNAARKEKDENN